MPRIMIVDDASMIRRLVRNALQQKGHEIVAEAVNGREALQMYVDTRPDVVTMDVTMKEMDGLTAAQTILKAHPEARIIMVTAIGQESLIAQAVKAGVKDFVVKPFTDERIQLAVENALAG